MKTYKIRVTKADISNGEPMEASACPVFLALRRKLKDVAAVSADTASICINDVYQDIPLPFKVGQWILRFDDLKPVKPFFFTLKVP